MPRASKLPSLTPSRTTVTRSAISTTVGVDVLGKDSIYQIVKDLAAEGMAVIMISDEIPEVLYRRDRILVRRQGRLTGEVMANRSSEAELKVAVDA